MGGVHVRKMLGHLNTRTIRSDEDDLHTAVLDLGMSQEANGGLVTSTPEISLGEVEGIVEANNGVELLGEGLEVGLQYFIAVEGGDERTSVCEMHVI